MIISSDSHGRARLAKTWAYRLTHALDKKVAEYDGSWCMRRSRNQDLARFRNTLDKHDPQEFQAKVGQHAKKMGESPLTVAVRVERS